MGERRAEAPAGRAQSAVSALAPLAPPELSVAASAVRDHVRALEERLASLEGTRALEATQLATARHEAESYRAEVSDAQRRLHEQRQQMAQLQAQVRELGGVSPAAGLRPRVEAARAQARALRAELPSLRAAVDTAFRQAAADVATVAREVMRVRARESPSGPFDTR